MRKGGLEPPRPKALPPQGSVSTNSTTTAALWDAFYALNKKKESLNLIYSAVFGVFDEFSDVFTEDEVAVCTVCKL